MDTRVLLLKGPQGSNRHDRAIRKKQGKVKRMLFGYAIKRYEAILRRKRKARKWRNKKRRRYGRGRRGRGRGMVMGIPHRESESFRSVPVNLIIPSERMVEVKGTPIERMTVTLDGITNCNGDAFLCLYVRRNKSKPLISIQDRRIRYKVRIYMNSTGSIVVLDRLTRLPVNILTIDAYIGRSLKRPGDRLVATFMGMMGNRNTTSMINFDCVMPSTDYSNEKRANIVKEFGKLTINAKGIMDVRVSEVPARRR
jgi:hypothetical protein